MLHPPKNPRKLRVRRRLQVQKQVRVPRRSEKIQVHPESRRSVDQFEDDHAFVEFKDDHAFEEFEDEKIHVDRESRRSVE